MDRSKPDSYQAEKYHGNNAPDMSSRFHQQFSLPHDRVAETHAARLSDKTKNAYGMIFFNTESVEENRANNLIQLTPRV